MSVNSYKAWLQNNGFVQSMENESVFELPSAEPIKIAKAITEAKTRKITIEQSSIDGIPHIVVM